jgi:8-oxo-dGTP pyrophosphatase MutT (NUDIX family)
VRLAAVEIAKCLRGVDEPSLRLRGRGDHDLNPGTSPPVKTKPAAVLVPMVDRPEGMTLLFTRRTAHLAHHAGQVSFPGGRVEEDDPDAVTTALRETAEEIGLCSRSVEIMGRLDDYVTGTGFTITPIVGVVSPPFELTLDSFEVAESFEVPLAFLIDPANRQRCVRTEASGIERYFYAFSYERHYIWGATAGILVNLQEALAEACCASS